MSKSQSKNSIPNKIWKIHKLRQKIDSLALKPSAIEHWAASNGTITLIKLPKAECPLRRAELNKKSKELKRDRESLKAIPKDGRRKGLSRRLRIGFSR
jgi:hypothetical protein